MTTRNLNETWRDVVFRHYATDYDTQAPFPIRYLIQAPEWKTDIWIEVPSRVNIQTFRRSVLDFVVARRNTDPVFNNEHISVRPRVSHQQKTSNVEQSEPREDTPQ
ncbi:hypothetical protein PGQ11_005553 [Apiospora arundinis]|uniref:Uncharacterized protein n=1 Tax=Apiospora arundinis TaxID=335852 RepID=A0ABR2JBF0_9PEZI